MILFKILNNKVFSCVGVFWGVNDVFFMGWFVVGFLR